MPPTTSHPPDRYLHEMQVEFQTIEKETTLIAGYLVHRPINSEFYFSSDDDEQLVLSSFFFSDNEEQIVMSPGIRNWTQQGTLILKQNHWRKGIPIGQWSYEVKYGWCDETDGARHMVLTKRPAKRQSCSSTGRGRDGDWWLWARREEKVG